MKPTQKPIQRVPLASPKNNSAVSPNGTPNKLPPKNPVLKPRLLPPVPKTKPTKALAEIPNIDDKLPTGKHESKENLEVLFLELQEEFKTSQVNIDENVRQIDILRSNNQSLNAELESLKRNFSQTTLLVHELKIEFQKHISDDVRHSSTADTKLKKIELPFEKSNGFTNEKRDITNKSLTSGTDNIENDRKQANKLIAFVAEQNLKLQQLEEELKKRDLLLEHSNNKGTHLEEEIKQKNMEIELLTGKSKILAFNLEKNDETIKLLSDENTSQKSELEEIKLKIELNEDDAKKVDPDTRNEIFKFLKNDCEIFELVSKEGDTLLSSMKKSHRSTSTKQSMKMDEIFATNEFASVKNLFKENSLDKLFLTIKEGISRRFVKESNLEELFSFIETKVKLSNTEKAIKDEFRTKLSKILKTSNSQNDSQFFEEFQNKTLNVIKLEKEKMKSNFCKYAADRELSVPPNLKDLLLENFWTQQLTSTLIKIVNQTSKAYELVDYSSIAISSLSTQNESIRNYPEELIGEYQELHQQIKTELKAQIKSLRENDFSDKEQIISFVYGISFFSY